MTWQLRHGGALESLRTMPAESVQTCVTSPPYFGLRDYGVDGQLGLELTPDEYVANLVEVMEEVKRVLRKDGTLWLNLGDSYASKPRSNDDYSASRLTNPGNAQKAQRASLRKVDGRHRGKSVGLKNKDLIGTPWMVAFALREAGWWLRSDVVWSKPNPTPESVEDRPTRAHEYIFLLTPGTWTGCVDPIYASDRDAAWLAAILDAEGSISIGKTSHGGYQLALSVANTSEALLQEVQRIAKCGTIGAQRGGVNFPVLRWQARSRQAAAVLYKIRSHLVVKDGQAACGLALQESHRHGGSRRSAAIARRQTELYESCAALNRGERAEVPTVKAGWTGGDYYYDHAAIREPDCGRSSGNGFARDERLSYMNPDGTARGSEEEWTPGAGANKRSVWEVAKVPYAEAHFACFPPKLIVPCILAGAPLGGRVLDPFAGSGTTLMVAERLGRDSIGIELNAEYIDLARRRITDDAPLFNTPAEVSEGTIEVDWPPKVPDGLLLFDPPEGAL